MERNLGLFKRASFKGGVHPAENKRWTEAKPVEKLPIPPQVIIPVQQHIGAPSRPVVEVGAKVRAGDPVSEAAGFVSVPAHASISGTVTAIEQGDGETYFRLGDGRKISFDDIRKVIQPVVAETQE